MLLKHLFLLCPTWPQRRDLFWTTASSAGKKNPGNQLCIFKYSIKIQYICGTSM